MRKAVLISIAAALFAPALPAQAESAASSSARSAPSAQAVRDRDTADDPNRQICVSERLSGSRMPRRVCRTAHEWQLLHAADGDER